MRKDLILFNVALMLYLIGLMATIAVSFGAGAILILLSASVIVAAYAVHFYKAFRNKPFQRRDALVAFVGVLAIGELFIIGYSVAIGQSLLQIAGFYYLHVFVGVCMLSVFMFYSFKFIKGVDSRRRKFFLLNVLFISSTLSLAGFLGLTQLLHGAGKFTYYGYVTMNVTFFLYFLWASVARNQNDRRQSRAALVISFLMILFWIIRWQMADLIPPGLVRVIFQMGFVLLIIFPTATVLLRTNYFMIVFVVYSILIEFYFIGFNNDFKYLADVSVKGCIGYEKALNYPINHDSGIPIHDLLHPPTDGEISLVRDEWKRKDFYPRSVRIEYSEENSKGDSIKVISHQVNGQRHYGVIRIPAGLNSSMAPILMALHGGGSSVDVLDDDLLYRIAPASCRDALRNYIIIAPSFRGDIVRGKNFCFRSEGYTGDLWAGASEDAVSFLEVIKSMYHKTNDARVLAVGTSRGATVGLLIAGLTNKIDHVIAISTHADFLNEDVFKNERVGTDYPNVFFTPTTSPENIRKRILESSPLYFADSIRSFEIHQGTADQQTTVRHAKEIEARFEKLDRKGKARFYFYEGKGHGYDDDNVLCDAILNFLKEK